MFLQFSINLTIFSKKKKKLDFLSLFELIFKTEPGRVFQKVEISKSTRRQSLGQSRAHGPCSARPTSSIIAS